MSNLKGYQWLTTMAKRVGGPKNLVLLIGASGAAAYKILEVGAKKGVAAIRKHYREKTTMKDEYGMIFEVVCSGKSEDGLSFSVGDQIRVLEEDGDAVLIEKIGDTNNPYFVSKSLVKEVTGN